MYGPREIIRCIWWTSLRVLKSVGWSSPVQLISGLYLWSSLIFLKKIDWVIFFLVGKWCRKILVNFNCLIKSQISRRLLQQEVKACYDNKNVWVLTTVELNFLLNKCIRICFGKFMECLMLCRLRVEQSIMVKQLDKLWSAFTRESSQVVNYDYKNTNQVIKCRNW